MTILITLYIEPSILFFYCFRNLISKSSEQDGIAVSSKILTSSLYEFRAAFQILVE